MKAVKMFFWFLIKHLPFIKGTPVKIFLLETAKQVQMMWLAHMQAIYCWNSSEIFFQITSHVWVEMA